MKKTLLCVATLIASFSVNAQWVQQPSNITPNYYVPFLDAVDDQVCWGLVADPLAQTNPVAEFTKTVDGGNLWISGPINNAAGLAPSCIFALNADTAWVAMWNVAGGVNPGRILRTNDGGVSWTHQTTAAFNTNGNFPNWVYFWDANNGVCLGDPTSAYFEIYTTTDGGTNWVRTPDADIAPEQVGEFGITDVFTHEGDSTIYFGTNQGRIYKTTDRGLHWTAAQTPFGDFIGAVAFRDANNGLCVSGGATGSTDVAYTSDGGATWNLKGTNTAGMNLILGMCYVPGTDSTYFISTPAAGSVNGTAYSPNDGTNWVLVDNLIHTDIEFVNDSTGWTGSNELGGPMMKWNTPIVTASDDVASQSIDVGANAGLITQNPKATFVNNGLNTQTFDVTMNITGGYISTKTITALPFFATQQVTFDPWLPAATGPYIITIFTSLAADTDHNNDTLTKNITVFDAFENYGWTSMPPVTAGTFGLASAFNLIGNTATSPGELFSIGGADFAAVQPVTNQFATPVLSWTTVNPMPSPKYQFSAQKVGDKIVCSGGYTAGFAPDANTYIYDVTTGLWSNGTAMPTPVGDYASGVYNDSIIYYIGGYDGLGDQNGVKIYDVANNTWSTATAKSGTPTAGLRGAVNGDKIVIVGGYSQLLGAPVAESYLGTINVANPAVITWTPIPDYPGGPAGRLGGGVTFRSLRPLVYFTGGDPTGLGVETMGDCWGYDLNLNTWLVGAEKTTPVSNISDLAGVVYDDSLWIASVSGYDGVTISTVNEWLNLGASPPLGTDENMVVNNDVLTIYPNPSNDHLTVMIKENSIVENITVTDIAGRVVMSDNKINGVQMIKLKISSLDAGVYILSLTNKEGNSSGFVKFVKE